MDICATPPCIALNSLVQATFLERENRFRVRVLVAGSPAAAHLANPGRLRELLRPGCTVWVRRASGHARATTYDLTLVQQGDILVSIDARLPNQLLGLALRTVSLECFANYRHVQAEVTLGHSRIDFLLTNLQQERCWLEAKSVTLVQGREAFFPDAPTKRGRRHLETLMQAAKQGDRAVIAFVVQRADVVALRPNDATDWAFGQALRAASASGVEILAWRCSVTTHSVCLQDQIPVCLDAPQSRSYNRFAVQGSIERIHPE